MYKRLIAASRGQTLFETAVALPIALLALFAVIYYCNAGIVSERTQLTARYGALNLFALDSGPAYSAGNIYTATANTNVCPAPPTTLLSNGAPLPPPTSNSLWNPGAVSPPTCTLLTKDLGGASFLMARYLTAGNVTVTATPSQTVIPNDWLTKITGGRGIVPVTASLAWVHAAWPGAIIACISKTSQEVEDLLTATETVNLASGWNPGSCNIQH